MKVLNYLKDKGRFLIAFVICCFVLGCNSMTNEAVIIEKDKCLKADMDYDIIRNEWGRTIARVICLKKK